MGDQFDAAIDKVESIRQKLIVKYGTAFSNLSVADQIQIIRTVISVAEGRDL